MALLKTQRLQLANLRKLSQGTNVKIVLINDIGAIRITGGKRGSIGIITMLGNTIGISPVTIVKARVRLYHKR